MHGSGLIPVFSTDAGGPTSVKTGLRKHRKTRKGETNGTDTEQHENAAEHLEDALDEI